MKIKEKGWRWWHFSITLEDDTTFFLQDEKSISNWESGDEVAIFRSYNYDKPDFCYIICNFSKKQWAKAALLTEEGFMKGLRSASWLTPDKKEQS